MSIVAERASPPAPAPAGRLWRPQRVLITHSARGFTHGRVIAGRAGALGCEVVELPGSDLDLDEAARARKLTKFGSTKFVYPAETMRTMREALTRMVSDDLPGARVLYWT